MWLTLMSWFTGRKIIWLQQQDGSVHRTLENKSNPFNTRSAYVYWQAKVGYVTLLEGGWCGGSATYVKRWREG